MATIKKVEDLDVFNRSYDLALAIHKKSLGFPDYEKFAIASQIRRASKGICANITEGFAKHHRSSAEFKRFLLIAIGSSEEMRLWLKFCKDLDYIEDVEYDRWYNEYSEITKMLHGLIKSWKD
jgi:four helix bundle protein